LNDPDKTNSNISVLEALYSATSAHLAEDEVDQAFQVLAGVRQGGPESPSLFCLLMDWVMRIFTDRAEKLGLHGVKLKYNIATAATNRREKFEHPIRDELNLLWAGFADDIGLFFTSELDLVKGIKLLVDIFDEFDLHLSEKKTETMILNDTRDDESYPKSLLKINGHDLKNVKTFCYLGSRIKNDEPTTGDFEIEARINLAKGKFESLKYILCNQKIYMWIRMMFFNAFVRSRMTYACQTWTLARPIFTPTAMFLNSASPKEAFPPSHFPNLLTNSVKNSQPTQSANQTLDTPSNYSSTTTKTNAAETTADLY